MHIRKFRNKLVIGAASLLAMMTAGCSMVTDAPEACPAQLRVRFVYDYNIKFADAFAHEVKSVCVRAFDSDGRLVRSDNVSALSSRPAISISTHPSPKVNTIS